MKITNCLNLINDNDSHKIFIASFVGFIDDIVDNVEWNRKYEFSLNKIEYIFIFSLLEHPSVHGMPTISIQRKFDDFNRISNIDIFKFPVRVDSLIDKNEIMKSMYGISNIKDKSSYWRTHRTGVTYNNEYVFEFLSLLDFDLKNEFIATYLDERDQALNMVRNNILTYEKINKECDSENKNYLDVFSNFIESRDEYYAPHNIDGQDYYLYHSSEYYNLFYVQNGNIFAYITNYHQMIQSFEGMVSYDDFDINNKDHFKLFISKIDQYECIFNYSNGEFVKSRDDIQEFLFDIEFIVNKAVKNIDDNFSIERYSSVEDLSCRVSYKSIRGWQTHSLWSMGGTGWSWSPLGYLTEETQYVSKHDPIPLVDSNTDRYDYISVNGMYSEALILNLPDNISQDWKDFVADSFVFIKDQFESNNTSIDIKDSDLLMVEDYLRVKGIIA
jgi:hypothetical protein